MLPGEFVRKLARCNHKLKVYARSDSPRAAGIYYIASSGEYNEVCGIDKNAIPEYPTIDQETGRILKGGWRRALKILIGKKLVDKQVAQRVFNAHFEDRRREFVVQTQDKINSQITNCQIQNMTKTGKPVLKKDEIMDLAKEISKEVENADSTNNH